MYLFYDIIPCSPSSIYSGDLVFLHGFLASGSNLKSFAKRFASEGFNSYLPDLRNHGQSSHAEEMSYKFMSEDIREFIEEKKIDKAILIGHSMGGKIVMQLAEDHPQLINKFIVLDMTPDYRDVSAMQNIVNILSQINLDQHQSRNSVKTEILNHLYQPLLVDFLLKNLVSTPKLVWRCNLKKFSQDINFLSEKITLSSTCEIESLFIGGEKSGYITSDSMKSIHLNFKNVKVKMIKNAGHWLHYEQPDNLFMETLSFLKNGKNINYN